MAVVLRIFYEKWTSAQAFFSIILLFSTPTLSTLKPTKKENEKNERKTLWTDFCTLEKWGRINEREHRWWQKQRWNVEDFGWGGQCTNTSKTLFLSPLKTTKIKLSTTAVAQKITFIWERFKIRQWFFAFLKNFTEFFSMYFLLFVIIENWIN